jgi:hypothetical protein
MIGAIMGIGGALAGALGANSASSQSWQRQHQLMEIQAELNQKNAKFNTAQAKEMWNYTNFKNQMKHIKEAGLSPGLIYGMGGQGGSTQGAGAANGVGLPQDQSVGMGLRAQEIGVEMANALSQIKLNESQANKNEAEANKIKGVDTEAQQATIDNLIAQTSNEKIKRGLILGQIRVADAEEELKRNTADWTKEKAEETRWNVKSLKKGIDKLTEEIDGVKLDNDLKRRTIDNKVKESALTLQNLMSEILLKGSQRKVNEEEAKAIPARILQGWEDLTKKGKELIIQREQMEAYTQDVINRLELGKKGLDIEEQKLVKDIVLGMLEIASKGAGAALGAKVGKTGFQ